MLSPLLTMKLWFKAQSPQHQVLVAVNVYNQLSSDYKQFEPKDDEEMVSMLLNLINSKIIIGDSTLTTVFYATASAISECIGSIMFQNSDTVNQEWQEFLFSWEEVVEGGLTLNALLENFKSMSDEKILREGSLTNGLSESISQSLFKSSTFSGDISGTIN